MLSGEKKKTTSNQSETETSRQRSYLAIPTTEKASRRSGALLSPFKYQSLKKSTSDHCSSQQLLGRDWWKELKQTGRDFASRILVKYPRSGCYR